MLARMARPYTGIPTATATSADRQFNFRSLWIKLIMMIRVIPKRSNVNRNYLGIKIWKNANCGL